MRGHTLDKAFRERLMLAVTAVNGCTYCSYYHAKQALLAGLTSDEIDILLAGTVENVAEGERPALLYAQHWAETAGSPDALARAKLLEHYSAETVQNIELTLQIIQMGNLLGNTFDFFRYRLSFGRVGA